VDDFAGWRLKAPRSIIQRRSWQMRATALDATEKAVQLPPDIVIPDLNIRGMKGIETAKRIRARTRSMAIVFLTEITDADNQTGSMGAATLSY